MIYAKALKNVLSYGLGALVGLVAAFFAMLLPLSVGLWLSHFMSRGLVYDLFWSALGVIFGGMAFWEAIKNSRSWFRG